MLRGRVRSGDTADGFVELPLDYPDVSSVDAPSEWRQFSFSGSDWGATHASDVLLTAALAVEVARYGGRSTVPILVITATANGDVTTRTALRADVAESRRCDAIVADVRAALHGDAPGAGNMSRPHRVAAITIPAHAVPAGDDLPEFMERALGGRHPPAMALVVATESRRATIAYNSRLFSASTIARVAAHLDVLSTALVESPERTIGSLPLITPFELAGLLAAGTGVTRSYPHTPLHERIAQTARETPERVAVRFRDLTLSYAELNRRANQLAHALTAHGAGVEARVVVCLEPSFDIAVALLGILKAGAVYVPLDPSYPAARIRNILDDCQPRLVVTQRHVLDRIGGTGSSALVIALDADREMLGAQRDTDPDIAVSADQAASVYYTSGTTGSPKGVIATHANLRSYIDLALERYGLRNDDVMPAIARYSFSISMFELMAPLVAGGTLHVLEREHVLDMHELTKTLRDVTIFHAGPSLLRNVVAYIRRHYDDVSEFAGVRHASSGGDMVPPELLQALKEVFPRADVFVIYGCTEISCMGCTYQVPRHRPVTRTYVGRPFPNTHTRVLDAARRMVPVGVVGEVHIAGPGVVRGYLNRDELTAERFVMIDGLRYYRTGDLGRMNAAGDLELVGRRDFQIKIRGIRIEPAEVEFALRDTAAVRDAVVVARAMGSSEKTLIAYIVPSPDGPLARAPRHVRTAAIRNHLRSRLPEYMLPALYVELDALPLTPNGKIDRRGLPSPEHALQRDEGQGPLRAPQRPTEIELAEVWRALLGVDRIGLDDNFFDLGGHSLLAIELILEVESRLGIALDGMEVLRENLEVLAAMCDERLGRARGALSAIPEPTEAGPEFESFYFGPDASLYGVYHAGAAHPKSAVLICAPAGEDNVRAQFVLHKLARRLAAEGTAVLHFDYFGTRDSHGADTDASVERWCADIATAYDELHRRSNAPRITGVGVRLGATLLANTTSRMAFTRIVLWDPVLDGAAHVRELSELHDRYVRGMVHIRGIRRVRRRPGTRELVGVTYADAMLGALQNLSLASLQHNVTLPVSWLAASNNAEQEAAFRTIRGELRDDRMAAIAYECAWGELERLGEILPDVGLSALLAQMVYDE